MRRWRRWQVRVLSFMALAYTPLFASAKDTLSFSRNARTFETIQSSLLTKSLAHSCLALTKMPDGLPCNPAFVGFDSGARLGAEALMSNGYSTLDKMRKLLAGEVSQDLINALFSEERVLQIEANAEIQFVSKYLNARYTPVTLKYFSTVRNVANPDVELYAVQEDNMTFQGGHRIFADLYGGVQLRRVTRKFVRQRFKLLDLLTEQGKDRLKPKEQSAFYVEPGLAYLFPIAWKPRIGAFLSNSGFEDTHYADLPTNMETQFGFAISPPFWVGTLDLTADYRSMNFEEDETERWRFGALLHYGAMHLGAGVDANGVSSGVYFGIQQINAGIMYSTTRVPWRSEDFYAQTVYLQVGWQI